MEMMKEIFGELWILLGNAVQFIWPEDPMLIGVLIGLGIPGLLGLLRKIKVIGSAFDLVGRGASWLGEKAIFGPLRWLRGKDKQAADALDSKLPKE